VKTRWRFPIRR